MKATTPPICPHCSRNARLVTGRTIYPHRPDLAHKKFWLCVPCYAWVGCHPGTDKPLGQPSNLGLRRAKIAAHLEFDKLWKAQPETAPAMMRRSDAYYWLSKQLGIEVQECHIGWFDVATCELVVKVCRARKETPDAIGLHASV